MVRNNNKGDTEEDKPIYEHSRQSTADAQTNAITSEAASEHNEFLIICR